METWLETGIDLVLYFSRIVKAAAVAWFYGLRFLPGLNSGKLLGRVDNGAVDLSKAGVVFLDSTLFSMLGVLYFIRLCLIADVPLGICIIFFDALILVTGIGSSGKSKACICMLSLGDPLPNS